MSLSNSENNPKAIICPKCKQELPEDSQFCHFCGANIEAPVVSPVETTVEPSPVIHTLNHTETAKKSKKKPIIIRAISAVAVALIAILIILFVGNNVGKEIKNVSLRTITFSDEFTAEYVYSTWKNGKATEQSLVELMNKYGAEQGDQGAGRLYFVKPGEYVEEIDEWCFSPKRKIGDSAIIKNAYGYSICYISDINSESDYHIDLTDNNVTNDNITVTWLSDYRFLYYEDFSKFVLLFELSDEDEKTVSVAGTVEIKIVNDDKVTVYDQKRTFSKSNFENWTYDDTVEMYLAAIYIEPKDITAGSTEFGTVYFTVYGDGYDFEECSISVFDLPTKTTSNDKPATNGNSAQTTKPQTTPPSQTEPETTKPQTTQPSQTEPETTKPQANKPTQTEPETTKPQQSTSITCLEYSCKNIVSKSGDYCSEHKCANSGCSFKKDYNSQYCTVCQCSKVGCKNLKSSTGYYCKEHTCEASGCTSEKAYNKKYCSQHLCGSCDNIRVDGGFYCKEHTCIKTGCTSKKSGYHDSDYCSSHQCMAGMCSNGRIDGGQYCVEHTCIVPGCKKQKLIDDYCYSHTS